MKSFKDIKNSATKALNSHWCMAALCVFVCSLFSVGFQVVRITCFPASAFLDQDGSFALFASSSFLVLFFVIYPLAFGMYNAFRLLFEQGDANLIRNSFVIGFRKYARNLGFMLLLFIKIFLWTLLLIIPGIVKSLAYSMAPYILEEHPEYSVFEAFRESEKMMYGHKAEFFWFGLSFIGWIILGLLTVVGIYWVAAYLQTSYAAYYNELKAEKDAELLKAVGIVQAETVQGVTAQPEE